MKSKTRYFLPIDKIFVKYWVSSDKGDFYIDNDTDKKRQMATQNWNDVVMEGYAIEITEEEAALL